MWEYKCWLSVGCQALVVNDCALRTRASSEWTVMLDLDEYVNVIAPPHRLLPFLETSLGGRPCLSMGSMTYNTKVCTQEEGSRWAVERMVFHDPAIYCKHAEKYER